MALLPLWFAYIAAGLRLGGGFAYVVATFRGKARPNVVSWLLWSLTPLISFAVGLSEKGFDPALIVTLATGISPLLVVIIALAKHPRSLKFNRLNVTCFIIALAGIGLWVATDHPVLAIALAILADIVSALPTLVKIIRHPYSEYLPTYAVNAFGMVLAIAAAQSFDVLTIGFLVYIAVINLVIIGLIVGARERRRSKIRRGIAASKQRR